MKRNAWKWWWAVGVVILAAVLADMMSACVYGEIECKPQYEPNEPIVVVVKATEVPEGAKLRGSIQITDASHLCPDANSATYFVWAGVGKHTITAQGVWVLTTDVEVGGQKVPILVDFGQYNFTKTFVVGEGGDVVPPPPPPPGQRSAVILEETEQRTPAQAVLFNQLSAEFQPLRLQILDDDQPAAAKYLQQAGSVRPVLLVFQGGQFLRAVPCPSSVEAVKVEVAK